MPQINRLRIINFSYNNDNRHILDETFNFHGGENALLSLANGGGKSVLVQLFLQPVIPNVRIQGRSLNGFFHKQKLPTFVLLEWKLDDGGGYLLTGIGIIPAEATGAEEGKPKIRYFTFTFKYNTGNAFDISKIPLTERNGNLLKVLSYREARDLLADKARKDPYLFGYFSEDDGVNYGKHLAEFGIVQDEWRNVIARINDNEGGIEEIFQKYKSSSQLLDEWIIKNIEKALFKEKSEMHRLEEMLTKLVQEVGENERFIVEKEMFTGFLAAYGEGADGVAGLLQKLDEQQKLAKKLASLLAWLTRQRVTLEQGLERNGKERETCRVVEQRISLEERSQDFILKKTEFEKALEELHTAEKLVTETGMSLKEKSKAEKIQQAARLLEEIRSKDADASGMEERLAAAKADYDKKERIAELEYSLKLLLEKALADLGAKLADLQAGEVLENTVLRQTVADMAKASQEKSELDQFQGRLKERKTNLEKRADDLLQNLELHFSRNLLGELDPKQIEKAQYAFEQAVTTLQQQKKAAGKDQEKTEQSLLELEIERETLLNSQIEEKAALTAVQKEIQEYEKKEAEVLSILNHYGLEPELRFDPLRLSSTFTAFSKKLSLRVGEARRSRQESEENLQSLQNGRLHIPQEWLDLLNGLELHFETGENYLRGLAPQQCQKMLEQNPTLPFAFILGKEDLPRIVEAAEGLNLNRVVPFLTYEDLNLVLDSEKRVVRSSQGIALACLYEGRIFKADALPEFQTELEKKKQQALEELEHYTAEYEKAVADQAVCARFNYGADHIYTLGSREANLLKRLSELDKQIRTWAEQKETLQRKQKELNVQINDLNEKGRRALVKVSLLQTFLENEHEYQSCRQELSKVLTENESLEARLTELAEKQKRLEESLSSYHNQIREVRIEQKIKQEQYLLCQNAAPARILEGSIEELTERLQALQTEYTQEVTFLDKRLRELRKESDQRKKDLQKLKLSEEDYLNVNYEEDLLDQIREEITILNDLLEQQQKALRKADTHKGATENAVAEALKEVKRLGYEIPLPPEDVRGDFAERRRHNRVQRQTLEEENEHLLKQMNTNERLREKIVQTVDVKEIEPSLDFEPEIDPEVLTKEFEQAFRILDKQNKAESERLKNQYFQLKSNYVGKNQQLDMIFHGVDRLWEEAVFTDRRGEQSIPYDRYYYLFECMSSHREKLGELINLNEMQLANLERNKKDMIEQSFLHGLRIFEEILWISDNSRVRLQGRSRPVQMLKVDLVLDSREQAKERMKVYIEETIAKVREDCKQNKKEEEIRRNIGKLMSSRELLNIFLGNSHIPVSVYKIDYNIQNSRLKLWEDAVRENSGGEKFVVFFAVLSALMSYARTRAMEDLGGVSEKNTNVLIMDNPFGPISSEHLLNPLFEIAKKHRTQLICLSDLKQNSIMNCFNLIYMLKIRPTAIGNQEYLKFEEVVRDAEALQEDEKLEKAVFRSSDLRQLSLFT